MGILIDTKVLTGGLRPADFPDGFHFAEIIDGKESTASESVVTLNGNMMPEVPFQFGGSQKLVKEYYPGNPEPTTQVLGARESDLTVKGMLKSKRAKDSALYAAPEEMQQLIDSIRIKGNLLRIWLGEWSRYGFLEECTFKMKNRAEIEYELKFSIVGFKIPSNNKFNKDDKALPLDVNTELTDQLTAFQDSYSTIPTEMPRTIGDLLNSSISTVASAINLVTDFVDNTLATAEDVVASANRAIGLVKNARTSLATYKRRIGAISLGYSSLGSSARAATNFKETFASSAHLLKSLSATITLSDILARLQKQLEAIAKTTPLMRYRVKDGDSLQTIAMRFYRDAGEWKRIYDHNKLSSTSLTVGTVLEIPRL